MGNHAAMETSGGCGICMQQARGCMHNQSSLSLLAGFGLLFIPHRTSLPPLAPTKHGCLMEQLLPIASLNLGHTLDSVGILLFGKLPDCSLLMAFVVPQLVVRLFAFLSGPALQCLDPSVCLTTSRVILVASQTSGPE